MKERILTRLRELLAAEQRQFDYINKYQSSWIDSIEQSKNNIRTIKEDIQWLEDFI
jgi:hypothetical protein